MMTQKVVCTDCGYQKVVGPDDEKPAAEYVIKHGKERRHHLRLEPMPDDSTKEKVTPSPIRRGDR